MKYYIGLDAHNSTSTFAVVDENGQCVLRETVKTSEQIRTPVIPFFWLVALEEKKEQAQSPDGASATRE